jgi:hypothetical protein
MNIIRITSKIKGSKVYSDTLIIKESATLTEFSTLRMKAVNKHIENTIEYSENHKNSFSLDYINNRKVTYKIV